MAEEHHFIVQKHARVLTSGQASNETAYLWIACHGYAQIVDRFVQKFKDLDSKKHFIVCPEGLSRFYSKGFSGAVCASWMTKQDRLKEIQDYSTYLSQVLQYYQAKCPNAQLILFGFSQGVATISRWLVGQDIKPDHLWLWAGMIPEDLDPKRAHDLLHPLNILFIRGNQDEFITEESISKYQANLDLYQIEFADTKVFDGGHRVDRQVLHELVETKLIT